MLEGMARQQLKARPLAQVKRMDLKRKGRHKPAQELWGLIPRGHATHRLATPARRSRAKHCDHTGAASSNWWPRY